MTTPSNPPPGPRTTGTDETIGGLLIAIPVALARSAIHRLPPAVVGILLTTCGMVLILSPLALWISWTQTIFNTVLAVAVVALIVAFALVMLSREDQR